MIETLSIEDGLYLRQTLFDKARRIVVKVGSAVLTDQNGIPMMWCKISSGKFASSTIVDEK